MGGKKTRFSRATPAHNLALQHLHVAYHFPSFRFMQQGATGLWRGTLQPRDTSPFYDVTVRYQPGKLPKVKVNWPPLAAGAPHLWPDGSLCLYWPNEWVWRGNQIIATTIIPWTASWLYFYELWLDCGEWLGPSSHDQQPQVAD